MSLNERAQLLDYAIRGLVRGGVQGVGFRAFVREKALALGIVGSAKNLSDGNVEVVLYGDRHRVKEMQIMVAQGPRQASVAAVTWELAEVPDNEGFDIR